MQQKPGNNMGLPQEYFLYFKLADNNEAVYPLSALRSVSCSADSKLDFYFDTIMKAFADEVNGNLHKNRGKAGNYLIVGDEIATAYFHANVTAVDSITRAA